MDAKGASTPALLESLPPKVRDKVLRNARRRSYEPGEIVIEEGESALNLYIVAAGHARVERAGSGVLGRFGPGDFFGELALLEESNRHATVVAEDGLSCYLIPAWEFRALLEAHPAIAVPMLHAVIDRLHTH